MHDSSNGAPQADNTEELTLPEAIMLLLFDPRTGAIAGEGQKLMILLGAATVTDLALRHNIELDDKHRKARAIGTAPDDPLLAESWNRVPERFTSVRTLIFDIGVRARESTLNRLMTAGHIHKGSRRILGFIPAPKYSGGNTTVRDALIDRIRAALLDDVVPQAYTATLITLLSGSRSLPAMNSDIAWSGTVHTRAKEFERGHWGAQTDSNAVDRTVVTDIVGIAFPKVLGRITRGD